MSDLVSPQLLDYLLATKADQPPEIETSYTGPFKELLTSADLGQLNQSFTERSCVPREVVFYEGVQGDTMFLIRSGQVAIVKGPLTSPTILAFRGPGEIFGEMALLEHRQRSASVIALEDTSLLGLNRDRFEQLLRTTPSVTRSIMEVLSARLRRMSEARSTGELSEKRLHQRVSKLENEKQRLEGLQRLRKESTESIIHDLRNPLNAIAISLKMLSMVIPEEVLEANNELMSIAQASTQRLQRLVDSLLEVSRMEMGETRFEMNAFDLDPLIQDLVQRTAILARKGVRLETKIDPGLPMVIADREKIERVILNLLDNALKYTPENGLIEIQAEQRGNDLWVRVSDSGPGVRLEDRRLIFERFTQGPESNLKRRGFGLGLAYCRLSVEGHGGQIWVEGGDGGTGSCFVFTLPISRPESSSTR
jgi:signal transduction histidine kinase